jgi:hypothetical protein
MVLPPGRQRADTLSRVSVSSGDGSRPRSSRAFSWARICATCRARWASSARRRSTAYRMTRFSMCPATSPLTR